LSEARGLKCPHCGCGQLVKNNSQTLPGGTRTFYRYCRNANCKRRFLYSQPPERLIREVKPHKEDDEEDRPVLKVRIA